jgi:hypothetical protein
MKKFSTLFCATLFVITFITLLHPMDHKEAPQSSACSLTQFDDTVFLHILRMLVPIMHSIKKADLVTNNGLVQAFVCIKIACRRFNNLLNATEYSKLIDQKALDTIFVQKICAYDRLWLPLLMQCGAKMVLPKAYRRELDLSETDNSHRLPHECTLAMTIDNTTLSESTILNTAKTLIAGGATTNYPHEPKWLYLFSRGTALDHAIRHKFHHVIDFLLSQSHPIEESSMKLAQATDTQIYLRLARCKKFDTKVQDDVIEPRPKLPSCTIQ